MNAERPEVHVEVVKHACEAIGLFIAFVVLVSLVFSAFLAMPVLLSKRSDWIHEGNAIFVAMWLNLAFPVDLALVLIHHVAPGASLRRAWFPRPVEWLFWANAIGWLCAGLWLLGGVRLFSLNIWWLAWLWS